MTTTKVRHRELLARMGYAASRLKEVATDKALATELIWPKNYHIENTAADRLQAFRERMRAPPDRTTPKRVYIRRYGRR